MNKVLNENLEIKINENKINISQGNYKITIEDLKYKNKSEIYTNICEKLRGGRIIKANDYDFKILVNEMNKGKSSKDVANDIEVSDKTLRNKLKNKGYKYCKELKEWHKEENEYSIKKHNLRLSNKNIENIDILGTKRYCAYDDQYINEPWEEVQVLLHSPLLKELEEISKEKNFDMSLLIEYALLNYLNRTRPINREKVKYEIIRNDYKKCNYDDLEIEFLMDTLKYPKANEEEDILALWYKFLEIKGYSDNELKLIENNDTIWQHYFLIKNNIANTFSETKNIIDSNEFNAYYFDDEKIEEENNIETYEDENIEIYEDENIIQVPVLFKEEEEIDVEKERKEFLKKLNGYDEDIIIQLEDNKKLFSHYNTAKYKIDNLDNKNVYEVVKKYLEEEKIKEEQELLENRKEMLIIAERVVKEYLNKK